MSAGKPEPDKLREVDKELEKLGLRLLKHGDKKGWSICDDIGHKLRALLDAPAPMPAPLTHPAQMALEHDRTIVAEHVTAMKNTLQNYAWLLDGRGSYEWDDDRYRLEFQTVCTAMQKHVEVLARIAADWSNCPTKWEEVQAARVERPAEPAVSEREPQLLYCGACNQRRYFRDGKCEVCYWSPTKLEVLNAAFRCAYIECPAHVIDDLKRRFDEYLVEALAAPQPPSTKGKQRVSGTTGPAKDGD
jgi:hypothetical protein